MGGSGHSPCSRGSQPRGRERTVPPSRESGGAWGPGWGHHNPERRFCRVCPHGLLGMGLKSTVLMLPRVQAWGALPSTLKSISHWRMHFMVICGFMSHGSRSFSQGPMCLKSPCHTAQTPEAFVPSESPVPWCLSYHTFGACRLPDPASSYGRSLRNMQARRP